MLHSSFFTRFVAVFSLLAAVAFAAPSAAHACKCMFPEVAPAREGATAVFEGRVTAMVDEPVDGDVSIGKKRVTLALVRTWKGLENKESVVVSTSASSASCGYMFEPNTSYLVYADGTESALEVSGCSRTRLMSDAADDLAVLGAGITPVDVKNTPATTPPVPATAPKSGGCGSMSGSASAGASLLFFPATGLLLGARRRRRA